MHCIFCLHFMHFYTVWHMWTRPLWIGKRPWVGQTGAAAERLLICYHINHLIIILLAFKNGLQEEPAWGDASVAVICSALMRAFVCSLSAFRAHWAARHVQSICRGSFCCSASRVSDFICYRKFSVTVAASFQHDGSPPSVPTDPAGLISPWELQLLIPR